eukprot:404381-Amphidinium_carterae.1
MLTRATGRVAICYDVYSALLQFDNDLKGSFGVLRSVAVKFEILGVVSQERLRVCAQTVSYTHLRAHETEADL